MKKLIVAAILAFGLAGGALAEGTITNPATANRFTVHMLSGQLTRMMVGYAKAYGATRELVDWSVYGTLNISYEEFSPSYQHTVHGITDEFRLMLEMSGDELERFKQCMTLLSVNQSKRELAAKLTPPQTISPWAQLNFLVEPGSNANTVLKNWGFTNLSTPGATLPVNNYTAIYFVGCTTNL